MLDIHDPEILELKRVVSGYARALQELAQARATLEYWVEDVLRAQGRLLKAEASLMQLTDGAMSGTEQAKAETARSSSNRPA
jgi:F0F1-type ATP synthase delta subunit